MAKVKFNVKGVDSSGGDFTLPKPGMYIAEIIEINVRKSEGPATKGQTMLEVVTKIVTDSQGKKKDIDGIGSQQWSYVFPEHEPMEGQWRQFLEAVGLVKDGKETGTLDTDKLVGTKVQIRVKHEKDDEAAEGVRVRVAKFLPLADDAAEPEEEDDDNEEEESEDEEGDESEDEDEEGDEDEDEDEDEETVDLSELDRAALKKFIKEEKLEITVKKSWTDDQIREAIVEAMSEDEDGEEEEDEEPEDDGPDFDSMDRAALKAFNTENDLDVKVLKKDSDDALRAKIVAAYEAKAGKPDYDSWEPEQLKAEIKERGLTLEGRFGKSKAVAALKADDASDSDPF